MSDLSSVVTFIKRTLDTRLKVTTDKRTKPHERFLVLDVKVGIDQVLNKCVDMTDRVKDLEMLLFLLDIRKDVEKMVVLSQDLYNSLLEDLAEKEAEEEEEEEEDATPRIQPTEYDKKLTLNSDVGNPKDKRSKTVERFLTGPGDKYEPNLSVYAWMERMGYKSVEQVPVNRHVQVIYNPRLNPGIVDSLKGPDYEMLNIYSPPPYFSEVGSVESRKVGELKAKIQPIIQVVDHLLPIPFEREFFWDWVYMSLFGRAQTYLVLCGKPGIGKTTLKEILKALHGYQNSVDGKKSTLTEKFNSQLTNCTMIWFDELNYAGRTDALDNLKQNQNDTVAIESKGVDATRGDTVYASMAISNNYVSHNAFGYDDRKFAPLFMTHKRLETSLTSEEIGEMRQALKEGGDKYDAELLACLYLWIKKRGFKVEKWKSWNKETMEYYGPMFYYICHQNMSAWAKFAFEYCTKQATTTTPVMFSSFQSKLNKHSGGHPPRIGTMKDFLDRVHDYRGKKVFRVEQVGETSLDLEIFLYAKLDSFNFNPKFFEAGEEFL